MGRIHFQGTGTSRIKGRIWLSTKLLLCCLSLSLKPFESICRSPGIISIPCLMRHPPLPLVSKLGRDLCLRRGKLSLVPGGQSLAAADATPGPGQRTPRLSSRKSALGLPRSARCWSQARPCPRIHSTAPREGKEGAGEALSGEW